MGFCIFFVYTFYKLRIILWLQSVYTLDVLCERRKCMNKNVLSVRVYDTTLDKIQQLCYLEKEMEKKYKKPALTKGEIVAEAIDAYYAMKLDKDTGADYLTRMNLMIQDALKQQNNQRDMTLNNILRYAMMSYEASVTMLKNFRLPDEDKPKDFEDAKNLVQNLDSIFEDSIFEKVAKELGDEVDWFYWKPRP